MQYCVYVALCKKKRLYVGQTKLWRIHTRWGEHTDPTCLTTRWTTEYPVIEKLGVYACATCPDSKRLEHHICAGLMARYGLDSVRGGGWNMLAEGPETHWWVPSQLKGTPSFTKLWSCLSGRKYAESVHHALAQLVDLPPVEFFSHVPSS